MIFCLLFWIVPQETLASETTEEIEAKAFHQDIETALSLYLKGDRLQGKALVGDAFYRFEQSKFHIALASSDPHLYRELETVWLELRSQMKTEASPQIVTKQAKKLQAMLLKSLPADQGKGSIFFNAFLITLREGFEALLILAALVAYLKKTKMERYIRILGLGAGFAILVSIVLFILAQTLFKISGQAQEILEGVTMLIAVVVLFMVSYWLISKIEADRWQKFIKDQMDRALSGKRIWTFSLLAFIVVFREGFETILFFQALLSKANHIVGGYRMFWSGFLLGSILLCGLYLVIIRYGVKIPIRPFFAVTGAFLYMMAFKFAGDGIRELQEGGLIGVTNLNVLPDLAFLKNWLGIYPYVETVLLQLVLMIAVVLGMVYTFKIQPRKAQERM